MSSSAEEFKPPLHSSYSDETDSFVLSKYSFHKVMVECNFAILVNLLNLDRIYRLEAAWIIEDISLIRDSFSFISFHSIPLQCNHVTLALASAAKENEGVIVWLEKYPFPIDLIE